MKRLALAALLSLGLAGCKTSPAPARADAGAATRIVSLSPSTTETLFVIGAGESVVGRSRYCDWPPEVLKLPQIGGYVDPSFEAILALRPDLVTGARGPAGAAMSERLDARGIATFLPQTESFAQIDAMILGLGERTGRAKEAKATVDALDGRVSAIEKAVASKPRVRVLLVFGLEPLSVAGPHSFADEMIRRAGGDNVVTEGGGYPTIGVERVMTLDPDVVVNAAIAEAHGKERISGDTPGWAKVRAVVTGRVAPVTDESMLRPGPRIGEGLATLARALHPDVAIP
jgi:iron complex transport system substrate-binding protein